jgi:hypothetical protein
MVSNAMTIRWKFQNSLVNWNMILFFDTATDSSIFTGTSNVMACAVGRSWLRHCAISLQIVGSTSDGVSEIFD